MMQWEPLCPLSRYPISTWEGYNSFLVYGLRWCKLWVSLLCNPWGPSACLLMVWNLLPPLVRQSESASPQHSSDRSVSTSTNSAGVSLCVYFLWCPLYPVPSLARWHVPDMLQEPQACDEAWPLLTLLKEGMGWNHLSSCGCWADLSPPSEGQHRDMPDLNLLGEWVRSWLPPNVPNPRGYDFILSLILLLVPAMLRTLLFSSFISSLLHCCRWSIQTKCKRKTFFCTFRCCWHPCAVPYWKRIALRGVRALSGPPTNLPEISWHFCFSLGSRHAMVWIFCFYSPHTSDLCMFQY